MPQKGKPGRRGPRPNTWVTGPDPETHRRYRQFIQQRNQAQWRGETWLLTFREWLAIWGDQYHRRGRNRDCMCMVRCDWDGSWTSHNAELVDRPEFNRRQQLRRQLLADRTAR